MKYNLSGSIFYNELGLGAWGIKESNGSTWRPIMLPEQLKVEGLKVELIVSKVEEDVSMHMWGMPCKIVSFRTPQLP